MEIDELVELDLFGKCSEAQEATLNENLQLWRDELARKLVGLDKQFAMNRSASLQKGTTEARKSYTEWKGKAIGRKLAIVTRLQDVKEMLKDRNREIKEQEESEKAERPNYPQMILDELRKIRRLLESTA